MMSGTTEQTPLYIIASVTRIVSACVDRISSDRGDYPFLVCVGVQQALKQLNINSQILYGQAAWVEVFEDQSVAWSGCWGEYFTFWVGTQYGELVDINVSISKRKKIQSGTHKGLGALYSPPMVWSKELPKFYRYQPTGIAEFDASDLPNERDQKMYEAMRTEIAEKLTTEKVFEAPEHELEFPNEPVLVPGRRILDDSKESFKHFERAVMVTGFSEAPI